MPDEYGRLHRSPAARSDDRTVGRNIQTAENVHQRAFPRAGLTEKCTETRPTGRKARYCRAHALRFRVPRCISCSSLNVNQQFSGRSVSERMENVLPTYPASTVIPCPWHSYRRRDRSVPKKYRCSFVNAPTGFRCWSSRQCRFRQAQAGIRPECPRCPPGWGWSRQTVFRFRFRRSAALQIPQFPPLC